MNGHSSWGRAVTGHDPAVDPTDLLANPFNARVHPFRQQEMMTEVLQRVGWVRNVLVNTVTGHVLDGHMRIQIAITNNETVPVDYVTVSEDDERYILATFDAVGDQALVDVSMFERLVDGLDSGSAVTGLFDKIQKQWASLLGDGDDRPAADPAPGETDEGFTDLVYGIFGWDETKVKCDPATIAELATLHEGYRIDHNGSDRGFVEWLINRHQEF